VRGEDDLVTLPRRVTDEPDLEAQGTEKASDVLVTAGELRGLQGTASNELVSDSGDRLGIIGSAFVLQ